MIISFKSICFFFIDSIFSHISFYLFTHFGHKCRIFIPRLEIEPTTPVLEALDFQESPYFFHILESFFYALNHIISIARKSASASCSVVSDSLHPHGMWCQAPLSWNSPSKNTGVGWLPFPSLGYLPHPGIEPGSPALQADSLLSESHSLYLIIVLC